MIFLLLNIIAGSSFMLFIKWAQVRGKEDIITIGALNYIVAAVLIVPFFLTMDSASVTRSALLTGGTMGISYFIAYFFVIYAIKWVGATSSTVIAVLSILVPIAFGVFLWKEQPNALQIAGVVLALASLTLIGGQKATVRQTTKPWFTPIILVIFFMLCGMSRLSQEAFRHLCEQPEIMAFNFSAFALAAIPSLGVLVARRKLVTRTEFYFGFAMGGVNFLQTWFILEALQRFDGFVVFPVVSAGSIILTALVATLTLGERLSRKTVIGIAIATGALILLKGFA